MKKKSVCAELCYPWDMEEQPSGRSVCMWRQVRGCGCQLLILLLPGGCPKEPGTRQGEFGRQNTRILRKTSLITSSGTTCFIVDLFLRKLCKAFISPFAFGEEVLFCWMGGPLNMQMHVSTYTRIGWPAGSTGAASWFFYHPDFLTTTLSRESEVLMLVYFSGMALEHSAVYRRWATQTGRILGGQGLMVLGGLCSKCPHPISERKWECGRGTGRVETNACGFMLRQMAWILFYPPELGKGQEKYEFKPF